jgi:hypothetical protein
MASAGVGTEVMYASKPGSRRNTSNDPAIISFRATIYQHRSEVDAAGEGGSKSRALTHRDAKGRRLLWLE